mgnify:CR=1 FL=1
MKTQYYVASTLDGFIATEGDSLDWLFPLGSLEESSYPEFIRDVGALALGAATYGSPWPYTQPAWVFTRRNLPTVPNADIRFVQGDVVAVHREMSRVADGKNIWVVGGGDLAGQFHDAGLLDELIVQIGSATLGAGKPLFPRQVLSPALHLASVRKLGGEMVELRYQIRRDAAAAG